jgi:hypothetical protein
VRPGWVDGGRHALRSKGLEAPPRAPGTPRPRRCAAVDGKNVSTGPQPAHRHAQRVVPPQGPVRSRHRGLRGVWLGPGPRLGLAQRPVEARSHALGTRSPLMEQWEARDGSLALVEGCSVAAGMTSRENAAALDRRGLAYLLG